MQKIKEWILVAVIVAIVVSALILFFTLAFHLAVLAFLAIAACWGYTATMEKIKACRKQ